VSWPPSRNIQNGLGAVGSPPSALAWGSEGLWSGLIVKSLRATEMVQELNIENGTGLTSVNIILFDGDQIEITVQDDRNVTFVRTGGIITTILNPLPNGAAATAENFQVVNSSYSAQQKQNGERSFTCKKYLLITPLQM